MLEVERRTPPERLYRDRYRKRVKPATAKNKEGFERAKPTEKGKKQLSGKGHSWLATNIKGS